MNYKKFTTMVTCILLSFLFVLGFFISSQIMNKDVDEKDGLFTELLKKIKPQDDVVNFLLMGLDKVGYNTDTIVVANYNISSGKVNLLSIPRDTKVTIGNQETKINAAYAIGKHETAVDTVSKLLGTKIQYFAIINTDAFKKVIDQLDGVEMDVPQNMDYEDPAQGLRIHLKKGRQVLNGDKAEQYMRYRSGYAEGDLGRVKAQKLFFEALLEQKLKPKYISRVDDIVKTIMDNMITNVRPGDIPRLAKGLGNIKTDEIQYFILPGEPINGSPYYYICDSAKTAELVNAHFLTNKKAGKPFVPPVIGTPKPTKNSQPFTPPDLDVKTPEAYTPATPRPSPTVAPENSSRPSPQPSPTLSPAG